MQVVQVAIRVVEAGVIEHGHAIALHHQVVHHFQAAAALGLHHGLHAFAGFGLVVRVVGQAVDFVEVAKHGAHALIGAQALTGQDGLAHFGLAQPGDALGPGQLGDLQEGGADDEGVQAAVPRKQQAHGPAADAAIQGDVLRMGFLEGAQNVFPQVRGRVGLLQVEQHGQLVFEGQVAHPRDLVVHRDVVRRHLQHAVTHFAQHLAEGGDFFARGKGAGRVFALVVFV